MQQNLQPEAHFTAKCFCCRIIGPTFIKQSDGYIKLNLLVMLIETNEEEEDTTFKVLTKKDTIKSLLLYFFFFNLQKKDLFQVLRLKDCRLGVYSTFYEELQNKLI